MEPVVGSPKGDLAEQEIFTLDQLVDAFELSGVSKSPAIFDIEKLTHFYGSGGVCKGG